MSDNNPKLIGLSRNFSDAVRKMISFQIDDSLSIELRELAQATARKCQPALSIDSEELSYTHRNVLIISMRKA